MAELGFMIELDGVIMKIIELIKSDSELCKYIKYNEKNPLSMDDFDHDELVLSNIFPMPKMPTAETNESTILDIFTFKVIPSRDNQKFNSVIIAIDVICDLKLWLLDDGVRPHKIANKIDKLFHGKQITDTMFSSVMLEDMQYKTYSDSHHGFRLLYRFGSLGY